MLKANFSIYNPYFTEDDGSFRNLFCSERGITEHKSYCFEITHYERDWLEFEFGLSWRGEDHAGLNFTLGLLTYSMHFRVYDNRHWNHETNAWYTKGGLELTDANIENAEKDRL